VRQIFIAAITSEKCVNVRGLGFSSSSVPLPLPILGRTATKSLRKIHLSILRLTAFARSTIGWFCAGWLRH